jgi:cytochrome c556
MSRPPSRALSILASVCLSLIAPGCQDENPNEPVAGMDLDPAASGLPDPPREPVGAASNPKLKEIMTRIGKGAQALQGSLSDALKQGEPAWDAIQGKAREYARLASDLGKHDPVKGSQESWAKLTAAFSETAAELDQAAKARDKAQASAALDALGGACIGCHRVHRGLSPPDGGPPGGGRPGDLRSSFGGGPEGYRPPPGYPTGGGSPPAGAPGAPPAPAKPDGEASPQ